MTGTLWVPGAERITPSLPGGDMSEGPGGPPRVVWHTTEAPAGSDASWTNVIKVLRDKNAEPQVMWDPVTDRLGQFMPLNVSARALRNDGTTKTNRVGEVCIQVEVMGYAARPFTDDWRPGPNYRALMAAIRSWGIPDVWPAGPPPRFIADPPHNVPEDDRDRPTWLRKGGHYSHSQIPGNDHGDPGGISTIALFAKAPLPTEDEVTEAQADRIITLLEELTAQGRLMAVRMDSVTNRQLPDLRADVDTIGADVDRAADVTAGPDAS